MFKVQGYSLKGHDAFIAMLWGKRNTRAELLAKINAKNCYIFAKSLHFFTFHSILPSISDFLQLKHLPLYAVELGVVQCAVNPSE